MQVTISGGRARRRLLSAVAVALSMVALFIAFPGVLPTATSAIGLTGGVSAHGTGLRPPQGGHDIGVITVEGALDPVDEEVVDWAVDRFREARLPLPGIRVSIHGDTEPCQGAQGGHRFDQEASRVLICITELGPTRELKLKRTLLHEFAHAWDAHFLADNVRKQFIELRGLEGWSFEVPYEERGGEHAAETITWGLMDEPLLFGSLGSPTPWEAQHSGYLMLTGAEPPHGYVWSLFAAGHDIYAHTPAQLEAVKSAWDRSEELTRRSEKIEVRFHRASESCRGETISSRMIDDRLHIQACPTSTKDLAAAFLDELTAEPSGGLLSDTTPAQTSEEQQDVDASFTPKITGRNARGSCLALVPHLCRGTSEMWRGDAMRRETDIEEPAFW